MLRAALPAAVRPPFPSGPCVPPGAPILREAVALAFRAGGSDASGSWGAAPSVFWFLLYAQKERPGGEPYRLCTLHILRDADRRLQIGSCRAGKIKLYYGFFHQSLRHGCAVPPPFTQGRLWVGAMPLRYPYTWVAFGCAGRREESWMERGVAVVGVRDCDGPRTAPRRQAERPMCIL